jgi:hypothetical protein
MLHGATPREAVISVGISVGDGVPGSKITVMGTTGSGEQQFVAKTVAEIH